MSIDINNWIEQAKLSALFAIKLGGLPGERLEQSFTLIDRVATADIEVLREVVLAVMLAERDGSSLHRQDYIFSESEGIVDTMRLEQVLREAQVD